MPVCSRVSACLNFKKFPMQYVMYFRFLDDILSHNRIGQVRIETSLCSATYLLRPRAASAPAVQQSIDTSYRTLPQRANGTDRRTPYRFIHLASFTMRATTSHEFLAHLSEGATLFAFVVIIQWQQIAHGSERCYRRMPFRIQMSEKKRLHVCLDNANANLSWTRGVAIMNRSWRLNIFNN